MIDTTKQSLLDRFSLLIKIINCYDGLQTYNTPVKLFKDVLNPEKNAIKVKLSALGVKEYTCEHGRQYGLHQICCCRREDAPKKGR